jgi:hypothetical protein
MTIEVQTPHLTKSKFVTGIQCHKKLWLDCHEKSNHVTPVPGSMFYIGNQVGEAAWSLFPEGILVREPAYEHAAAVETTRDLMARADVPAIFEAAFEYENIRVRVDVLERMDNGGWRILEIKSSSKLDEHHKDDVAIQYLVLKGCEVDVRSVELGHADKEYVRDVGDLNWRNYFHREEMIDNVLERQPDTMRHLAQQVQVLASRTPPKIEPTKHRCSKPFTCDYWERCTKDKPLDWLQRLYRINWKQVVALAEQGIVSASNIVDEQKLNANQLHERDAMVSGKSYVSEDLGRALEGFGPPAHYLDFEFSRPAYPYYQGMSAVELIAFQWSSHFVESIDDLLKLSVSDCLEIEDDSRPNYRHEYLADGPVDPSAECAEKLLEALGQDEYPILVYHVTTEKSVIESLAKRVPERRDELLALLPRLKDLLPIVRSYTCLPEYFQKPLALDGGTYSIKTTASAFDPKFDYANLVGIAKGDAAPQAYYRLFSGDFADGETREKLREDLLKYCQFDTIAMIVVHKGLLLKSGDASND